MNTVNFSGTKFIECHLHSLEILTLVLDFVQKIEVVWAMMFFYSMFTTSNSLHTQVLCIYTKNQVNVIVRNNVVAMKKLQRLVNWQMERCNEIINLELSRYIYLDNIEPTAFVHSVYLLGHENSSSRLNSDFPQKCPYDVCGIPPYMLQESGEYQYL